MQQFNPTSKIISAIDRYSRYLNEFTNQQINITEKTTKILEKKKLEEFGAKIQEQLKNASNLSDMIKMGSTLISDAISNGLTEAIPLINQQLELKMREYGFAESEKLNKLLLENNKPDELFIQGDKLVSLKNITDNEDYKQLNPELQNKYLSSLQKPQYKLGGSIVNGKEQISESIINPNTGEILQTQVYDVYTKGSRKYYKKNNIETFVPDYILDEMQNERLKNLQMQYNALQLQQISEGLKTFNIKQAQDLQQTAYYFKKDATGRIIDAIAKNIIDSNPDTYTNNENDVNLKNREDLYKKLETIYTPENITQFTTPEGKQRLKNSVGNEVYLTLEPYIKSIEQADKNYEKSSEMITLATDYMNDKNFHRKYEDYKQIIDDLAFLDYNSRKDYVQKNADKFGIKNTDDIDDIVNRLGVIIVNYKQSKGSNKVKQVHEFYKLRGNK